MPSSDFESRFASFQGLNHNVMVEYVPSEFIQASGIDEMATLAYILEREHRVATAQGQAGFNALVDLCGVFKRSSIHDVRDLVLKQYGAERFHYVYHIG